MLKSSKRTRSNGRSGFGARTSVTRQSTLDESRVASPEPRVHEPRSVHGLLRHPRRVDRRQPDATSSGRIGGWRGGITRASIPGIARPKRCSQRISEAYETLVDPAPAPAVRRGGRRARRRARGSTASLEFTEFDFSLRRTARRRRRSRELFADVLHPAPARGQWRRSGAPTCTRRSRSTSSTRSTASSGRSS